MPLPDFEYFLKGPRKNTQTHFFFFIFVSCFSILLPDTVLAQEDQTFLSQLNDRVEKVEVLRKSMNETLTPKERLTKKHLNFLSKIEKQVSPQEFEAIRASLEDSREIPVSEINKLYEERVSQAKNEVSPKAKEEILRVSGAFDQLTKKSSSDQRRSVPAALAASSYRPLMIPQSPGDFDSFDEASSKSEELTSQKVPWELEQEPRVLRPEDYELQEYSPEKVDLEPFEDDSLFVIVSKAYKRNIRRINRPKAEKP